jgi:hypothetical protein
MKNLDASEERAQVRKGRNGGSTRGDEPEERAQDADVDDPTPITASMKAL